MRYHSASLNKGKLRTWGGLNWSPELLVEVHRFAAAAGLTPPTAIQLPHNVIDRGFVEGPSARRALEATGVAVVASYCLVGGLLTGKYSRPGATGRHGPQRIEKLRQQGVLDQVDGWARLAAEHGATAAQHGGSHPSRARDHAISRPQGGPASWTWGED